MRNITHKCGQKLRYQFVITEMSVSEHEEEEIGFRGYVPKTVRRTIIEDWVHEYYLAESNNYEELTTAITICPKCATKIRIKEIHDEDE